MKVVIDTNSSSPPLELIQNGRLLTLPLAAGDLHSLLPDEDGRHLYVAMKDNLLSTSLDDITQNPRKVSRHCRCVRGRTHRLPCIRMIDVALCPGTSSLQRV